MNNFLDLLLDYYSFSKKDYDDFILEKKIDQLVLPKNDDRLNKVLKKLKELINNKTKTLIYGDYDVDGITSTAILYLTLNRLNLKCGYYIPSRYNDGYGITKERIKFFKELNYSTIITVDNGINAIDEIEYAKSIGIEIIIIDHHEINSVIPNTEYIFHHHLSKFINYEVSAAFLTLIISYNLLNLFDPYFVFLSGIAALSDVMPIIGNNIILIRNAITNMNKYKYLNINSILNDDFSIDNITFNLIPTLNAPGRIDTDIKATLNVCKFLIEKDNINEIRTLREYLINKNNKKKELIKNIEFDDSKTFISKNSHSYYIKGIFGIGGLISNKYLNIYNVPIMVVADDLKNDNYYVGSIRAPKSFNLIPFIKKYESSFVYCGGHEQACGFTLEKSKYLQLVVNFSTEMELQGLNNKIEEKYLDIDLEDLTLDNYQIYSTFMPFGPLHEKPKFRLNIAKDKINIKNDSYAYINNSTHGKVVIFNNISKLKEIQNKTVSLIGNISKNIFNNNVSIQLIVDEIL